MDKQWTDFETAIRSGDADRVNEVIDQIKSMSLDERVRLFDVCFDDLTALYTESDDGYVRQSTVRVAEQLTPGIGLIFTLANDDPSLSADVETIRTQTDEVAGFLMEALTDEDGRVRNSTKRALKKLFRTYDSLDDKETIEALALELEEMATEYSDKRRKHLIESKSDAEFFLQSGFGRIVEGIQKEFGDELEFDD